MQPMDPHEKSGIHWDIVILFFLLAIGLVAIGLIFDPVFLYLAGALLFIANLFLMVRRRKRVRQEREKEWINTDDLF